MRLHALILALCALHAYAASIPDKKDIEKKLAEVVKEVLKKDEAPAENIYSEQELIEQSNNVKDVENNLRKSAQPIDIPVKVVVEDVQTAVKSDADRKENNEVVSEFEESSEIKREEIDIKNPGPPQHMEHNSQHPVTFDDAAQKKVVSQKNQYAVLQKDIKNLKEDFESKMLELRRSIEEYWNVNPVKSDSEKKEDNIKVRSGTSAKDGATTEAPGWGGPWGSAWQNFAQSFQTNLQNLNNTVTNYYNNQTNSSTSNNCGNTGNNIFNWGNNNPFNANSQQGNGQQTVGQQSDERPPNLWQNIQQNVQNFLGGGGNPQPPAGVQSDTPQPPSQPNRPVLQAFQTAIQQAGSFFRPPGAPIQGGQQAQPAAPAKEPETTQAGSNVVPTNPTPETEKQKPEQPITQSGPIKQILGNNAIAQGIAGAVQRIQHTIIPTKPRENVKSAAEDKEPQATKGGLYVKPIPNHTGSGNNSSGVEKKAPEEIKEQVPVKEEPIKEEPVKEELIKEKPAKEETVKEDAPPAPEKTE